MFGFSFYKAVISSGHLIESLTLFVKISVKVISSVLTYMICLLHSCTVPESTFIVTPLIEQCYGTFYLSLLLDFPTFYSHAKSAQFNFKFLWKQLD